MPGQVSLSRLVVAFIAGFVQTTAAMRIVDHGQCTILKPSAIASESWSTHIQSRKDPGPVLYLPTLYRPYSFRPPQNKHFRSVGLSGLGVNRAENPRMT